MSRVLTLLTDFGLRDGYVGAMKGAILSTSPGVTLVDLTHEIEPGRIEHASYALAQAAPHFPPGTVHLVVVDPGVGGPRRALAARIGTHFYVAPDNGVLTDVLQGMGESADVVAHQILDPRFAPAGASPVFHGRDIFGPAAAHLASYGSLTELGPAIDAKSLIVQTLPPPQPVGLQSWVASVAHVDRFGNVITNLPLPEGTRAGFAQCGRHEIAFARSYGEVKPGALLALRGSSGFLEIACNGASAAAWLRVGRGAVVEWRAR